MRWDVLPRSMAFAIVQAVATPVYALIALLTFPFPPMLRYRIISSWSRLMVWAAERICGIRYRVLGTENIPREPCIILSKHQSAWETLAFQVIFPPQVWVIKRELLWVPFFGWGLAMLRPIAIDRRGGAQALRQTLEQGRERLARGFSIVIFPEGTRTAPGTQGSYHPGGAWLAIQTGAPGAAGGSQCRHVLAAKRLAQVPRPRHGERRSSFPSGRRESTRADASASNSGSRTRCSG